MKGPGPVLAFLLVVLFMGGCGHPIIQGLRPSNLGATIKANAYLTKVEAIPLRFRVADDSMDAVWARGREFVQRYSSGLHYYESETTLGTSPGEKFSYEVGRSREEGIWWVGVACSAPWPCGQPFLDHHGIEIPNAPGSAHPAGAERNAHILAYYLQTGELPHPGFIAVSCKSY